MTQTQLAERAIFEAAPGHGGPSPLRIVWERKSLVALGLAVGLAAAALYCAQRKPVYLSTAQVLVVRKTPNEISGVATGLAYSDDYVGTQQVLLRSPKIIDRAVADIRRAVAAGQLASPPTVQGLQGTDLTDSIAGSLSVSRSRESGNANNILNLSFRGPSPDECQIVLNAVIKSYTHFLDENYRNISEETLKLINQGKDNLQLRLAEKQKEYKEFRRTAPPLPRNGNGSQDAIAATLAKRTTLRLRQTDIEAELATIERALKQGGNRPVLLWMVSDAARKLGKPESMLGTAEGSSEQLFALLLQEQSLLEDYGSEHPQVQAMRNKIRLAREFYARKPARGARGLPGTTPMAETQPPEDPIEVYVQALKQELEKIQAADRLLAAHQGQEQNEAKTLTDYELRAEELQADIAQTQQFIAGIIKRLQDAGLVKDVGGYTASTIAEPRVGWKVEPNAFTVFPGLGLLGLLGGLGLAYLAEITDKSFRTPEEIRNRLGLPVVGHIPVFAMAEASARGADEKFPGVGPALCTYHRSQSPEAEAYRGVRTALYFSALGGGHQVIQVTSPSAGDGKTTLVANLAVSMAQTGKKVLLIDADLRKPRLHKIFGLPAHTGLSTVIAGQHVLEDAIQETAIEGLAVLPAGPLPLNPAELLTSPPFKAILDYIRDQAKNYDFVLIDSPPLLAVTDASVVAPHVDGVLLTIRISPQNRQAALRAKELLSTLGATVVGVVVNGIGRTAGASGYQYQQYRYGYYTYSDEYISNGNGDAGDPSPAKDPNEEPAESVSGPADGPGVSEPDGTAYFPQQCPAHGKRHGGILGWWRNRRP